MILDINETNIIRIGNMLENLVASVDTLSEHVKNAPPVKVERPPKPSTPLDTVNYPKAWRIERYKKYCKELSNTLMKVYEVPKKDIEEAYVKHIKGKIKDCEDPDELKHLFYALLSMEARAYEDKEINSK